MNDTLTYEQALELLPEGDSIHTFRQAGPIPIGCDWEREDILDALQFNTIYTTGDIAQSMGHGIAIQDKKGWLFIETKKAKAEATHD